MIKVQEQKEIPERCCATCSHLDKEPGEYYQLSWIFVCYEGGFSEIGNPTTPLTEEDCNGWEKRES